MDDLKEVYSSNQIKVAQEFAEAIDLFIHGGIMGASELPQKRTDCIDAGWDTTDLSDYVGHAIHS